MTSDPLDDTSHWTLLNARFETPKFIRDAFEEMFDEWLASLPEDSPALALHRRLKELDPRVL